MKMIKTYNRQKNSHKKTESGNMILALFAAVALVGTIGASTTIIMRGPMKVMSNVNQKTMTESQLMLSSKMVMLDAGNMTTADCDADRLNEPREWSDAGGLGPDGVAGSDGGGFIPAEIGISKSDTWGNQYGYCVWDHGGRIDYDDADDTLDCLDGASTQRRLGGLNSVKYPVVAVISAGPNGIFETPCRTGANADIGTVDGDLEDPGDLPLIERGGDDMIVTYSYAEASKENPSLWSLDYDDEGNVLAVMDNSIENVDFVGSNTSFGGNLAITGVEGLNIPDEIARPTCDMTTEREMRRNMTGATPILEICEDTGGSVYAWTPLTTGSAGGVPSLTTTANDAGPGCVPTSESISMIDTITNATTLATVRNVAIKGNYAFVPSSGNDGITSFDISDPHNLVELDDISNAATMNQPRYINVNGNYAYVTATGTNTLTIIDISNPTNMVELDSYTSANISNPRDMAIQDGYAFVTNAPLDGVTSFDISDPNNIIELDTLFNSTTMDLPEHIMISGNYAFVTGISSNSFTAIDISDPSNMTEVSSLTNSTILDRAFHIRIKDSFAYVSGLDSNTFAVIDISDPSNMVERGYIKISGAAREIKDTKISGNYLFSLSNDANNVVIIDITDPDNPMQKDIVDLIPHVSGPRGMNIVDNYLFVSSYLDSKFVAFDLCVEDYQSQVTVTQPAISGTTIGSLGWSQVNPSENNGDQVGIAFVVDEDAHKGSAPMAALSAIREGDPALAGLAFKTKNVDGIVGSSVYLGTNGRLALETSNAGNSSEIYSYLQIGDHGPGSWNSTDYLHGLLVVSDSGATDQIAYFGFEGEDDASGSILFSKDLRFKYTNATGDRTKETIRFESDQATTFFADLYQQAEGSSAQLLSESYASTATESGYLYFDRSRGSIDSPTDVENGDTLGTIILGEDAQNTRAPRITAVVSDDPTNSGTDIPTDLIFKTGEFQCTSSNDGPFVEAGFDTTGVTYHVLVDGDYIYAIIDFELYAFTFDGTTFTEVASVNTPGTAYDIATDGTYIYIAAESTEIVAYSFDGSSFTQLDTHSTGGGNTYHLITDGPYIYLETPSFIRALTFDGTSFADVGAVFSPYIYHADGTYVYTGTYGDDRIFAYTFDGTTDTLVGTITGLNEVLQVWDDGTYIYVADGTAGVRALTFDGTTFTLIDTFSTGGKVVDVWGDGTYIYAGDEADNLYALAFDGTSFTSVDNVTTSDNVLDISGDGTYIYAANNFSGLRAYAGFECPSNNNEIRITKDGTLGINKPTPEAKVHSANRIRSDEGIMIGNDTNCAVSEDIGVMRYTGVPAEPFEVCDGTTWQGLSTYSTGPEIDTTNCSPISFELMDVENAALNTDIETNKILIGGLENACDLSVASDASNITINKNGVDETGTMVSVDNGDVVYLKIRSANAEITKTNTYISLGDKTDQVTVETECTGDLIEQDTLTTTELDDVAGMAIDGDYAYLVSYAYDGIISVDISDPTNLVQVDSISSIGDMGNPGKLVIQDDVAYIAAYGYSRIASVDISDPTNLVILDSTNGSNVHNPGSVAVKGDYAFLANSDGVISIDISDPSNMSEVDHLPSADMDDAADIVIIDDHAFVVAYTDRTLTSVDISDPTNLVQVDSTTSPSDSLRTVGDMVAKGHYIFATSNVSNSVAVFDVSDPANLTEIESFVIPSAFNSGAIALLDNYIYVGDTQLEGVAQIDISDPISLSEKSFVTSTNIVNPVAIKVKDDHVFVGAAAGDSITSFKIKCQ